MSEFQDQGSALGQGGASMASAGSAGALIRRAREDAGVHIAALAVALKVPVKRLEALEADRYDLLTDVVFARALAGSVCRHLKIDPHAVLSLLPQGQLPPLSVEGKINEPFRSMSQGTGAWPQVSRPALIAAAVLAVAALAVYLVPQFSGLSPNADNSAPQVSPAAPAAGPVTGETHPTSAGSPAPAVAPGMVIEPAPLPSVPAPVPGQPAAPAGVLPTAPVPATPTTR